MVCEKNGEVITASDKAGIQHKPSFRKPLLPGYKTSLATSAPNSG
jgi:hypothetical protein